MKKLASVVLSLSLAVSLAATASADGYDPDADYMSIMIAAAQTGDYAAGEAAELMRDAKIDASGMDYTKVDFEDLYLLAKIIYAEAGSEWLSDQWKMCVGEVVLNRVASPEFPDTIAEVLSQPGQYYGSGSGYFNRLMPTERCVRLALRLLEGERVMNEPSVVFQANFRQGSGVCLHLFDSALGSTYFCYSNYPGLYVGGQTESIEPESPAAPDAGSSTADANIPVDENLLDATWGEDENDGQDGTGARRAA